MFPDVLMRGGRFPNCPPCLLSVLILVFWMRQRRAPSPSLLALGVPSMPPHPPLPFVRIFAVRMGKRPATETSSPGLWAGLRQRHSSLLCPLTLLQGLQRCTCSWPVAPPLLAGQPQYGQLFLPMLTLLRRRLRLAAAAAAAGPEERQGKGWLFAMP